MICGPGGNCRLSSAVEHWTYVLSDRGVRTAKALQLQEESTPSAIYMSLGLCQSRQVLFRVRKRPSIVVQFPHAKARSRRNPPTTQTLTAHDPLGRIIQLRPANILWIG